MIPSRYDMSIPANQHKLEAAQALGELRRGGRDVADRDGARVRRRPPAVTAAIIGPRTMEQLESQLPALERALSADVLDRIDEIVAPGTNVNQNDTGWDPPWLTDSSLRRR